jgi:hypothetical protein
VMIQNSTPGVDEAQGIRYILQRFDAFFSSRNVDGIKKNRAAVSEGFRRFGGTPGSLDLADMRADDFAQRVFRLKRPWRWPARNEF